MALDKEVIKALNDQIAHEINNSIFYMSCGLYFDHIGYPNIGKYFELHGKEEKKHAKDFIKYLQDNGIKPKMPGFSNDFTSFLQPFELAVDAEQKTSAAIDKLCKLALEKNDYRTYSTIAAKYQQEQIEEDELWNYNLSRAKLAIKENNTLKLDHEMAQREANGNTKYKAK